MSVLIKKSRGSGYVILEKSNISYFDRVYTVEDIKDNKLEYKKYQDVMGVVNYTRRDSPIEVFSIEDDVIDLTLSDAQIEYLKSKDVKPVEYLYDKICVGGYSGGSCWGGEPVYRRNNDINSEFTELDEFLEKVFPEIPFLKYKSLKKDLIKEFEFDEYEYYGNTIEYIVKLIVVKDMLEFLGIV